MEHFATLCNSNQSRYIAEGTPSTAAFVIH